METEVFKDVQRNYSKGDYCKLREKLSTDWDSLLDPYQNDAQAQFKVFHEALQQACVECIPYVSSNTAVKNTDLPWTKICVNSYVVKIVYGPDTWRLKTFSNIMSIANVEIKPGLSHVIQ